MATSATAQTSVVRRAATRGDLPIDHGAVEALQKEFGKLIGVRLTPHFRIAYKTDELFADRRAELFESAYDGFHRYFADRGFSLTPPTRRLEVVLLGDRDEFDEYVRRNHPAFRGSQGFYTSEKNRIMFFNAFTDPTYWETTGEIDRTKRSLESFRSEVSRIGSHRVIVDYGGGRQETWTKHDLLREISQAETRMRQLENELLVHFGKENVATTVHECIHLLAFNMGLQSRTGDAPRWISEGLATFFESAHSGQMKPPGSFNGERWTPYNVARRSSSLIPIAKLVSTDSHFGGDTALLAYAQSWALTHFLLNEHPKPLRDYLATLASKKLDDEEVSEADERLTDFREAFGEDLARLDAELGSYMERLVRR